MSIVVDPVITLPPDLVIGESSLLLSNETWHLPRSIYRDIRKITNGQGVKVAVLDTGCNTHPSLPSFGGVKSFINGQDATDPMSGHGTHVTGTVLSRDEDIGVAPGAIPYIGKVLSNQGSGSSTGIEAGILWAIEQKVDVASMSLGGGSPHTGTNNAIKKAVDNGIVVCIAAGNSGFNGRTNTIGWPAKSGQGVVVGALNRSYLPATFSSGGVELTVMAPGEDILSCDNRNNGYRFMSGTSMACPFVAGCFALIISFARSQGRPSMTGIEAINRFISNNATDLLSPGHDHSTGYGMFSMLEILNNMKKDALIYV